MNYLSDYLHPRKRMKRLENRDRIQGAMPSVKPMIEKRVARWASRDRAQADSRYKLRQHNGSFVYAFRVASKLWPGYQLPKYENLTQFHEAVRKGLGDIDRDSASLMHTMARDWILLNRGGSSNRDLVAKQMRSMVANITEQDPFAEHYIQTKLDAALEDLYATSQTVRSNLTLLFAAPALKKTLSDEVYRFKRNLVGKVRGWLKAQIALDMDASYDFLVEDSYLNSDRYTAYYQGQWSGSTTYTDDYGDNKWWYAKGGTTSSSGNMWTEPSKAWSKPQNKKRTTRKTTFKTTSRFSMREDRALLEEPFEGLSVSMLAHELLWGIHDTLYRQSDAYAKSLSLEELEKLYGREDITILGTSDYTWTDMFPEELDIKTLNPRAASASSVFAYEGPIKVNVSIFVGTPQRVEPMITCQCRASITLELPNYIWKYNRGDK